MPRKFRRRTDNEEFFLFQPKEEITPCGWAVASRCSRKDGDRLVSEGSAVAECDSFGNVVAYRLLARPQKPSISNGAADAPSVAILLTAREMNLVAGQHFRCGRSRTARMTEMQRLSRVHPLTRKPLPAEDDVERAAEKMRILSRERLPLPVHCMQRDALRAAQQRDEGIAIAAD